ncbi:unnamed protein product [Durusdinium trenchii]|uniref:Ubiquitin-like domain-containing protein n=1 Tax=Durusdinium trenchii TaxID=1381693 RepID=A0ABP0SUU5_9DINO
MTLASPHIPALRHGCDLDVARSGQRSKVDPNSAPSNRRASPAQSPKSEVVLPSGRSCEVKLSKQCTVLELKVAAQRLLNQNLLKLLYAGTLLDASAQLSSLGSLHGETLNAVVQVVQITATREAFALWCHEGGLITWGHPGCGGLLPLELRPLQRVRRVVASFHTFAAIVGEGEVVTWGYGRCAPPEPILDCVEVCASGAAFAAQRRTGEVVTWGEADFGGDSSQVETELREVVRLQASEGAFAAVCGAERRVVAWGHPDFGGVTPLEAMQPVKEVTCLCASEAAFAAVCGRGRVVTWGHPHFGGDSGAVAAQLTSVRHVVATCAAFCALRHDGSLVAWGVSTCGGTLPSPAPTGVASLAASNAAFAAVTERGVVTWGISGGGGDSSRVQPELYDVLHVVASARAFCALRRDGAIITWGDPNYGAAGPSSAAAVDRGHGRWTLAASERAFAALSAEGQLITWGDPDFGGDCSGVQEELLKL